MINDDEDSDFLRKLGFCFIILVFIGILIETIFLIYSYAHADEVKCNWLWCEFTQKKQEQIISRDCFENEKRVNCSDIKPDFKKVLEKYQ